VPEHVVFSVPTTLIMSPFACGSRLALSRVHWQGLQNRLGVHEVRSRESFRVRRGTAQTIHDRTSCEQPDARQRGTAAVIAADGEVG